MRGARWGLAGALAGTGCKSPPAAPADDLPRHRDPGRHGLHEALEEDRGGAPAQQDRKDRQADLLIATVAAGGSVHFMHPVPREDAVAYWRDALADPGRIVLGGFIDAALVGTVTLWLATPPNQPFRAEIWKLMTDPAVRRRGVARALMLAAEQLAVERGRTLLNLDTAADHGAAPLYDALGWTRAGEIPGFAYRPHGGLTATVIYYKQLAPTRQPESYFPGSSTGSKNCLGSR